MTIEPAALALLQQLTGNPAATFRPGQLEAITRLVEAHGRTLVVQRTGWGKSAVYFIATRLLRDGGAGPTVLISPLLALMRNQLDAASRAGVVAVTINSANQDDWPDIEDQIRAGAIDLLLISPERLQNERFRDDVLPQLIAELGMLVVDEAHCISDWGHDFRPDYRRISQVLEGLPPGVPVLCTTATANDRVIADVVAQLGDSLEVLRGRLERESLRLAVVDLPAAAERLAWLATVIPDLPGSGIIYCLTIHDTRRVADWLRTQGIDARAYSGDDDPAVRIGLEDALLANELKVLVATSALGMGFDKPDLGFVIHYQSPGSPIAYYQQVGRAGRALDEAYGILLCGWEDRDIQDHFITTAFPERAQAEGVVARLEASDGTVTMAEIEGAVNVQRGRLSLLLKVLEVDGAVSRAGGRWRRTEQPWAYDADRVERVTAHRREEQDAMATYASSTTCRMVQLRRQLDDPGAAPCGRCDACAGAAWDVELPTALVAEALAHLRRGDQVLEPRARWAGGAPGLPAGNIKADERLAPGRILSVYGDGGWGGVVREAHATGVAPIELLEAADELVRRWSPTPWPVWVTFVPSTTSTMPADLAIALGAVLGLSVHDVVRRVADRPPQSAMDNSTQQLANVDGAFEVSGDLPGGPVLLVDDVVDSRWTMTVVGSLLRRAGAGQVHPFALAQSRS
ncbi:MAG: RecQ family ATP-dependent DNA helicase [Acidimicrobiales bacterium]